MKHKKSYPNYYLWAVIAFSFLLLTYNINKPFIGHHDWNGAFWGTVVKNYLYHINNVFPSLGVQKEAPYYTQFIYYQNYTPLLPILFTIPALFVGVTEASLRLTTVFFSIIMLLYIYKIARLLYGEKVALFSAIFASFTPMFIYFGKLPDHEPIITSLITVTYYYYLKLKTYKRKDYIIFLCLLTSVLLESWSGFIFLLTLFFYGIFFQKRKLRFYFPAITIAASVIFLHLSFLYLFYGPKVVANLFTSGIGRISAGASPGFAVKYSFLQFLDTEAHYLVIYFTRLLVVLAILWFIKFLLNLKNKHLNQADIQLLPLAIFAAAFILIFNNLAFIHDYKLYLLLPFISIASAQMLWTVSNFLSALPKNKSDKRLMAIFLCIVSVLIIVGVFTERLKFLKTQLETSFNTPGYELGIYLNSVTPPGSNVLINSSQFHSFFNVFMEYYGNRRIIGRDLNLADFKKDTNLFPFIVLVEGRTSDPQLQKYLDQNYNAYRQKNFTIYNMQKKNSI